MDNVDVLVVGAGPVGLTLSIDLAQRGVRVLLVEKNPAPLSLPKMERSNPRSMEHYRRLGLVERIRAAAYPADASMDVIVSYSLADEPLVVQQYPSVDEMRAQIEACRDGTLPREPYQLISQYTLEPILLEEAKATPGLTVWQSAELIALSQEDDCVNANVAMSGGEVRQVTASYLIGSDGGSSTVRKQVGIEMVGRHAIGTMTNIFFRCDDLLEKSRAGQGRHYCIAGTATGGGAGGVLVVQDDKKHFAFHAPVEDCLDPAQVLRDVTKLDIDPEVIYCGPWTQHLLMAERHSAGRVFLCGDSNHLFIPAGGLGMNSGIADGLNLAWKIAGVLQGWGGEKLLESYHVERNAATRRNLDAVTWACDGIIKWRSAFTPTVLESSPAGKSARDRFQDVINEGNRRVYEMNGADRGYRYWSEIICGDEGPPPPSPITSFEPTTWPGAHLPHVWLGHGKALYDHLATDRFTLLVLNGDRESARPMKHAFDRLGAPLDILFIDDPDIQSLFERDFILVRPDFHISWRGDDCSNADRVATIATGA